MTGLGLGFFSLVAPGVAVPTPAPPASVNMVFCDRLRFQLPKSQGYFMPVSDHPNGRQRSSLSPGTPQEPNRGTGTSVWPGRSPASPCLQPWRGLFLIKYKNRFSAVWKYEVTWVDCNKSLSLLLGLLREAFKRQEAKAWKTNKKILKLGHVVVFRILNTAVFGWGGQCLGGLPWREVTRKWSFKLEKSPSTVYFKIL